MEEQVIINKQEGQNSFEFGKASKRFKLYYKDQEDLNDQLKKLKDSNLVNEEDLK